MAAMVQHCNDRLFKSKKRKLCVVRIRAERNSVSENPEFRYFFTSGSICSRKRSEDRNFARNSLIFSKFSIKFFQISVFAPKRRIFAKNFPSREFSKNGGKDSNPIPDFHFRLTLVQTLDSVC